MEHLSDIKIFLKVVHKKGFSAAASELNLSQSAVSKHVARLEASLGVQLLNRSTHQLSLTEAGQDFFARAIRIVAELEDAKQSATALSVGMKGLLRVHATFGVGQSFIAPAIAGFLERHPDISVQLVLAPGDTVNVLEQDIDITIRLSTDRDPLTNQTSLASEVLGTMRYLICGTPDYFRRVGYPKTPKDLDGHNCLVHSLQAGANHWRFTEDGKDYFVRVSGNYSCNSGAALYGAVERGIGIARILEHVARERLASGAFESIFSNLTASTYKLTAYFPRSRHVPAKTRAFLDCLKSLLQNGSTGAGDHTSE